MKHILLSIALLFVTTTASALTVPGKIVYKNSKGSIVSKPLSLSFSKETKEVVAHFGKHKIPADYQIIQVKSGRTLYYLVFNNPPGMKKGKSVVTKGTVLRGNNMALYYGDFFAVSHHGQRENLYQDLERDGIKDDERYRYLGGFYFKYMIKEEKEQE